MIKTDEFLDKLKNVMVNEDRLEFLIYNVDISNGSSYDGFTNYTDGFINIRAYYTPFIDDYLTLSGGTNEEQQKRAKNAQKIIDSFFVYKTDDYWYDCIRDDENLLKRFPTKESFKEFFETAKSSNEEDSRILDNFYEYNDDYYSEYPAFIGIMLKLYDMADGTHEARLESYVNDDFGYGRESVGGWARQMGIISADGSSVGNHYIYLDEFCYDTFDELKSKLKEKIDKAYDSLGL